MNERGTKVRILVAVFVLMASLAGLGSRLTYLHILVDQTVRDKVQDNRRIERHLLAGRGRVLDRNGASGILAINLAVKDVCADPSRLAAHPEELNQSVTALADFFELTADELAVRLNRPERRFEYIKRFVHEEQTSVLSSMQLPGVFFRDSTVRYYPQDDFMCHILGFVNREGVGSAGIEQQFDRYLRGSPGILEGNVNALRQELYTHRGRYVPALEGADVELTVDQYIQHMVEKALDDVMQEYHAKGAWAIVQHVSTGAILAMASRPSYDPNEFYLSEETQRLNRAIGYVYEPGSTFKCALFAAALNEGVVTPDTVFDCENGAWTYANRVLRDYSSHGHLSVADGLKKSSNILTAKVALLLGDKLLYEYLSRFWIGRPLGIDLPGEEAGILHPVERWSKISATRISIGQGVAVTGLQMLSVVSAIANDGYLMRPFIVKRVLAEDGTLLFENSPRVLSQPIRSDTAEVMRHLMQRVTEQGGTGRRASVEGYAVAGKTGTAQKAVAGGYSDTAHMASFAGFLPADAPQVAVIVVVDEPQPVRTGGRVAAPVFGEIASNTMQYLNIAPLEWLVAHRMQVTR